ncbi:DUF883 family protein [Necropsobacter massiliensis]|uniref:DUF883 family protein n=1 Tax=Necropsobacter massiliensis TaxID=1400001 RepID=UPI000595BAFD|nr:DUF883 family protein [Necropsobacter massiliensis]
MSESFEQKRTELLEELNEILNNAEELFNEKTEAGADELKKLKKRLNAQVKEARGQFGSLQEETVRRTKRAIQQTDELVQENPYKAIGVAGVIGLLLGVLISKK